MTLKGLRVLNTRPLDQGVLLNQDITAAGGIPIALPALVIEPTSDDWVTKIASFSHAHHAIFISPNAVHHFFSKLQQHPFLWPTTITISAIGQSTAKALATWKIPVDHVPIIADSKHLLELDVFQNVHHQTILLVKGEGGRMEITETLMSRGAHLISIDVYRRALPKIHPQCLRSLWYDNSVDVILFTSQQSIHNLLTLLGTEGRAWLCKTPCVVISERLAHAARMLGIKTIFVSDYSTIPKTLEHVFNEQKKD
jgi:uroporphyrinogen-III synthase